MTFLEVSTKRENKKLACFTIISLSVFLSALILCSCTFQSTGSLKDTLRLNLANEPPSLDWHVSTDSTSFDVVSNLMVGLTQYKQDLSCGPSCAKSWDILDNGKRYIFHLREDAFWSDGKKVRAQDFEYAWKRILDPKTAAPYAFFLYDLENGFEYNSGKITDPNKIGVHCLDDKTLEVILKKPTSYFLNLTSLCSSFPQRKDILEKYGNRWTEAGNMVVNGPFLLKKWIHEYKIELEANPTFFEGCPKIKNICMFMIPEQATAFALYENGQLDFIDNRSFPTPEVHRNMHSKEYKNFPLLRNNYLGFNVSKAPFNDKRVRLAFSMAIDRSIFPKILRRGEKPSYTWIPEGLIGYSPGSGPEFDPKEAQKLLTEAGFPYGKKFPKISILYPTREDTRLVMEAIQDQLKRNLNISVELSNQELKVYFQRLKKDPPPIFRANWGADYPDPETFANVFTSYNANNDTGWKNKAYDKLIDLAESELDTTKRASLYAQADKMLCKEEAVIASTFLSTQNIMCKPWVHGIASNPLDLQFFKDAWIE